MPTDVSTILKLEVPVIVQIASRMMSVREVAALAPGAIIELPKLADEELELLVSNRPIGTGTAVKVGENFGLRIHYVGDLKQRIRAMGDSDDNRTTFDDFVVPGSQQDAGSYAEHNTDSREVSDASAQSASEDAPPPPADRDGA